MSGDDRMVLLVEESNQANSPSRRLPLVAELGFEDSSPFGLQGLGRDTLTVLKPDSIKQLAASLALSYSSQELHDSPVAETLLGKNPQWSDEFRVVHLIESSLWFEGQKDFVMQMLRNPSQIPDNPPAAIRRALAKAYATHPEATVWYGVPVFGDQKNADGLPIPLTASEVRAEAKRRLAAAEKHAHRMGWFYRLLQRIQYLPRTVRRLVRRTSLAAKGRWHQFVADYQTARKDAKRRNRAKARRQLEYTRSGKSTTVVPEHSTRLGRSAALVTDTGQQIRTKLAPSFAMLEELAENHQYATVGAAALPMAALSILPMLLKPAAVVACDPFLFIELPDEPGKLRMIGHWYWQPKPNGQDTLHVHV